jgi:hypothetical protein
LDLLKAAIRHGQVDSIPIPDTGTLRGDVLAILTEFNNRRSRIVGLIAARLGAYYDQAATPETLTEIVDDIFLPLATNFGKGSLPST